MLVSWALNKPSGSKFPGKFSGRMRETYKLQKMEPAFLGP